MSLYMPTQLCHYEAEVAVLDIGHKAISLCSHLAGDHVQGEIETESPGDSSHKANQQNICLAKCYFVYHQQKQSKK